MRWNGTDITNVPTVIFHEELLVSNYGDDVIPDPDGPGSLICSSETVANVTWLFPAAAIATVGVDSFRQRRETGPPTLAQLTRSNYADRIGPRNDPHANGLWRCEAEGVPTLDVGLYLTGIINN